MLRNRNHHLQILINLLNFKRREVAHFRQPERWQ